MIRGLALLFAVALSACAVQAQEAPVSAPVAVVEQREPITILISIDGFRPDYLGQGNSPRLDALAASGATGPMRPSFPSKTFPNHWTIVTGERPDKHGIVANNMEDASRPGEKFTMATDDPFWWNAAPPIWVDAEKQGVRTATMFWPGANVGWGGTRAKDWPNAVTGDIRPQDWQQFNQVISGTQRVNAVLDYARRPVRNRPKFLTLYFDTVDTAGHSFGLGAPETVASVRDVDALIGTLVDGLVEMGQPANLVIVADHGMAPTSSERTIALDKIAPATDYRIVESGPYASLEPLPGREEALAKALTQPREHMQCWRKSEIPARFHYGSNARIPPWLCLAEPGWSIVPTAPTRSWTGGNHGYDHEAPDMLALFIASGPAFKPGIIVPAFDNVDVYPMLARLIGITPHASDGNAATLAPILKD